MGLLLLLFVVVVVVVVVVVGATGREQLGTCCKVVVGDECRAMSSLVLVFTSMVSSGSIIVA
jgi:hypothetical protein